MRRYIVLIGKEADRDQAITVHLIGQEEEMDEMTSPPVLPSVRELKHKFHLTSPDLKTQVTVAKYKIITAGNAIFITLLFRTRLFLSLKTAYWERYKKNPCECVHFLIFSALWVINLG